MHACEDFLSLEKQLNFLLRRVNDALKKLKKTLYII